MRSHRVGFSNSDDDNISGSKKKHKNADETSTDKFKQNMHDKLKEIEEEKEKEQAASDAAQAKAQSLEERKILAMESQLQALQNIMNDYTKGMHETSERTTDPSKGKEDVAKKLQQLKSEYSTLKTKLEGLKSRDATTSVIEKKTEEKAKAPSNNDRIGQDKGTNLKSPLDTYTVSESERGLKSNAKSIGQAGHKEAHNTPALPNTSDRGSVQPGAKHNVSPVDKQSAASKSTSGAQSQNKIAGGPHAASHNVDSRKAQSTNNKIEASKARSTEQQHNISQKKPAPSESLSAKTHGGHKSKETKQFGDSKKTDDSKGRSASATDRNAKAKTEQTKALENLKKAEQEAMAKGALAAPMGKVIAAGADSMATNKVEQAKKTALSITKDHFPTIDKHVQDAKLSKNGKLETKITLNDPSNPLHQAILTLTTHRFDPYQMNIHFTNLTHEAIQFLSQESNKALFAKLLGNRGITVHQITGESDIDFFRRKESVGYEENEQ